MRGFSLIEIIISLGLILITITIFGVAVNTLPLTKNTRNQNVAYHIAAKKIEELRNTQFASLPASGAFTDPGLLELASSSADLVVADYEASNLIKKVTVTVKWSEQANLRTFVLETLMSSNGLNKP